MAAASKHMQGLKKLDMGRLVVISDAIEFLPMSLQQLSCSNAVATPVRHDWSHLSSLTSLLINTPHASDIMPPPPTHTLVQLTLTDTVSQPSTLSVLAPVGLSCGNCHWSFILVWGVGV